MVYNCIIIGGGLAGLSTALVLGRAKLNVLLIDNNDLRNKVTHESHGFITNDSLSPDIIREKAAKDLMKYVNMEKLLLKIFMQRGILIQIPKSNSFMPQVLVA